MHDIVADPVRTYAIVVGIERYGISGLDLPGPASDACRFAGWLRSRGVPAENIRLFVSPLPEAEPDLATLESVGGVVRSGPADRESIRREFLERLPEVRGDLLWVFWGGHGQLGEEERYLLYANTSERDFATLDARTLTQTLQDRGYSGLSRQVFIIDACANSEGRHRPSHHPDRFPFPDRRNRLHQFVWMGSRTGEVAKNDPRRRTGIFSDAVLSALERASDEPFPPDLTPLATEIGEDFRRRYLAGGFRQTPVTYRFSNWGEDEVKYDFPRPSSDLARTEWSQPRLLALLEVVWPRLHHRFFLALGRTPPPEYELVQNYLASLLRIGEGDHPNTYEPLTGVSKVPEGPAERGQGPGTLAPGVHEQVRQKLRVLSDVTQGGDGMTEGFASAVKKSYVVNDAARFLSRQDEPMVLLGEAGSGKSRTLIEIASDLAHDGRRRLRPKVVIRVHAARFRSSAFRRSSETVWELVEQSLPEPFSKRLGPWLPALADAKRLVILFDGIDEMERDSYLDRLIALSEFARLNRRGTASLFACRINDFSPELRCRMLILQPFDRRQVREFVRKNLGSELPLEIDGRSYDAAALAERLMSDRDGLGSTARNPQILSLVCEFIDGPGIGTWPKSRAELFRFHINGLYDRLLGRLRDDPRFNESRREEVYRAWAELAFRMTRTHGGVYVRRDDLSDWDEARAELALESGSQSGLLACVEMGSNQAYRFTHHRFQEYLTAHHLANDRGAAASVRWDALVDNPRWQETLLNLVSMEGGRSEALAVVEASMGQVVEDSRAGSEHVSKHHTAEEHERLLADRVEFASRIIRELGGERGRVSPSFRDAFVTSLTLLARKDLPTTQVKMLLAWQNSGGLCPIESLEAPLRSKIDWVKGQAIVAVASQAGTHVRGDADLAFELGLDLANSELARPSRCWRYYGAVRNDPVRRSIVLRGVVSQYAFLAGVMAAGLLVLALTSHAYPVLSFFRKGFPGFTSAQVLGICYAASLVVAGSTSTLSSRPAWWRLAVSSWAASLLVFFINRTEAGGFPIVEMLVAGPLVLVVMLLTVQGMYWGVQASHVLLADDLLSRPRRETLFEAARAHSGWRSDVRFVTITLGVVAGAAILYVVLPPLGTLSRRVDRSFPSIGQVMLKGIALFFLAGLCLMAWGVVVASVQALAGIIREVARGGWRAVRRLSFAGARSLVRFLVYQLGPWVAGVGGVLFVIIMIFTVSETLWSWDIHITGRRLIGLVFVLSLGVAFLNAVESLLKELLRHVAPVHPTRVPRSASEWARRFRREAGSPTAQWDLLRASTSASLRITPGQWLSVIVAMEPHVAPDPAASEYWRLRFDLEQSRRVERTAEGERKPEEDIGDLAELLGNTPPDRSGSTSDPLFDPTTDGEPPVGNPTIPPSRPRRDLLAKLQVGTKNLIYAAFVLILADRALWLNRIVYCVNGLPESLAIRVDGAPPVVVEAGRVVTLVVAEGDHRARVFRGGKEVETIPFSVRSGNPFIRLFDDSIFVLNPLGAAILRRRETAYSTRLGRWRPGEARYFSGSFEKIDGVDPPFQRLPERTDRAVSESKAGEEKATELIVLNEVSVYECWSQSRWSVDRQLDVAEHFLRGAQADHFDYESYVDRCREQGRLERAKRFLQSGLDRRPIDVECHRAWVHFLRQRRDREAIEVHLRALLESAPEDPGALAVVAENRARVSEANADVTRALTLVPDDAHALRVKAECSDRVGEFAKALEACDLALKVRPVAEELRVYAFDLAHALGDRKGIVERSDAMAADWPALRNGIFSMMKSAQGDLAREIQEQDDYISRSKKSMPDSYQSALGGMLIYRQLAGQLAELRQVTSQLEDRTRAERTDALADLATGRLERFATHAAKLDPEPRARAYLVLSVVASAKGRLADSSRWRQDAVKALRDGISPSADLAADLLDSKPPFIGADDLNLEPTTKATALVALAQADPEGGAGLIAMATRLVDRFRSYERLRASQDYEPILKPIVTDLGRRGSTPGRAFTPPTR